MSPAKFVRNYLVFVVGILAISTGAFAQKPSSSAESREMPPVTGFVLTPHGDSKATVAVEFKQRENLPEQVTVGFGDDKLMLRRAKNGQYVAEIDFDFKAFVREQERRMELKARGAMIPVFSGRGVVGMKQVEFINPKLIEEAIRLNRPINIPGGVLNGITITIDPARELMITDLSVVEDPSRTFDPCTGKGTPMGAWTFGKLMTDMANGTVDPAKMVEDWLNLYGTIQNVNSFQVQTRTGIQSVLLNNWKRTSSGELDLSQAPMRLLAIVNRIDLRENTFYGGGSAGEGRFVFGVLDASSCSSLPRATVILEYGVPKSGCAAIHKWANQWHALGSSTLGSLGFNPALQAITDQFTAAKANPAKPNGSALDQLRTDEAATSLPWELREFHLDGTSHELMEAPVKQTPELSFNLGASVTNFINTNQAAILAGTYVVPAEFPVGTPFLGGSAPNGPPTVFWNGSPAAASNDARQQFSLGTCNGCHGSETNTPFLHIHPRPAGTEAVLSAFLVGNGTSGVTQHHSDS